MSEFTMTYNGVEFDVEAQYMDCPDSPREWADNLGTMLTWTRSYRSPDENDWEYPYDWTVEMLNEYLSIKELLEMLEAGKYRTMRLRREAGASGETLIECLNVRKQLWRTAIAIEPHDMVEIEAGRESACDMEILEQVADDLSASWDLLSEKLYLLRVYMMDHGLVSYSTSDYGDPWDSGCVGVIYATKEKAHEWFVKEPDPERVYKLLEGEVAEYSAWASGEVAELSVTYDGEEVAELSYLLDLWPDDEKAVEKVVLEECRDELDRAAAEIAARPHLYGNKLAEKLAGHVGHQLVCERVGDEADPTSYRVVCRDCFAVLVDAEKGLYA